MSKDQLSRLSPENVRRYLLWLSVLAVAMIGLVGCSEDREIEKSVPPSIIKQVQNLVYPDEIPIGMTVGNQWVFFTATTGIGNEKIPDLIAKPIDKDGIVDHFIYSAIADCERPTITITSIQRVQQFETATDGDVLTNVTYSITCDSGITDELIIPVTKLNQFDRSQT